MEDLNLFGEKSALAIEVEQNKFHAGNGDNGKHYGRDAPEMRECDQCEGTGYMREETAQWACHVCGGSGEVSVEQEEPEARERDE